jgi:hypothetical protein
MVSRILNRAGIDHALAIDSLRRTIHQRSQ